MKNFHIFFDFTIDSYVYTVGQERMRPKIVFTLMTCKLWQPPQGWRILNSIIQVSNN